MNAGDDFEQALATARPRSWPRPTATSAVVLLTAALSAGVSVAVSLAIDNPPRPTAASPTSVTNLGAIWGRALTGAAPQHEPLSQAEHQANQVPRGAHVDRRADAISFTGSTATITFVANPPNGRDMAFRSAGLENPTIEVRRGTRVRIHFVNGDSDSAHGWLLLEPVVTAGNQAHGPRAFPGSYAPVLGDPTSAGQAAEWITFRATTSGTYRYECPVPGHAAMGMQGTFVVNS